MTYVVTYIDVQPDCATQAIVLLQECREAVAAQEGNSAMDVLQEISRQSRFVLVEAWKDELSFRADESAEHTARFRVKLSAIHNSPNDQRLHHGFALGPAPAAAGVFCVVTHVDVPPPRKDETEVLLQTVAGQSRNVGGNLRFDVYQQNAPRTNHFTVFTAWTAEDAFASHELQPYTRQFREALGPMLGAPYDDRLYKYLY